MPSSGLILFGTTFEGYYALKWQLDTGQVVREYIIVCHGWVQPTLTEIDAPIHHIPASSPARGTLPPGAAARRSTITEQGKPAKTLLRVLAHATRGDCSYSLLAIRICTGRRHQIRAHLHHVGHPTVTDGKYTRAPVFADDRTWCQRNFLHRQRLQFRDVAGEIREATESLPHDLRAALGELVPVVDGKSPEVLKNWARGCSPLPWHLYEVLPLIDPDDGGTGREFRV